MWVSAALRLAFQDGRGGLLAVLRGPQGLSVLSRIASDGPEPAWMRGTGPDAVAQDVADAYVERQLSRDPDLWVVEFDTPDLLPPFGGKIV